jgi:DNA-binding response OmpR family regulator
MAKRILVIDDEPVMLKVVSFRLKNAGYEVVTASSAGQGLALIRSEHPDLVLLDVQLPDMTGFEVCRRVKQDDALKGIPVVFFTASNATDDMDRAVEQYGAQGCIRKPFEPQELLARIQALLERGGG